MKSISNHVISFFLFLYHNEILYSLLYISCMLHTEGNAKSEGNNDANKRIKFERRMHLAKLP